MFSRIFLSLALFVVLALSAPIARAQSADIDAMVARMQAIMSEMQTLQAEFQALASQLSSSGSPSSGAVLGVQTTASAECSQYVTSLEFGETNENIKRMQRLLATDSEIYSYGVSSGFFGPKTEEALMNLQERFGYNRAGVVGPATTELLKGWYCAYPNENYPDGVLSTKPTVLGAATSNTGSASQLSILQQQLSSLTGNASSGDTESSSAGNNPLRKVYAEIEGDTTYVDVVYLAGGRDSFEIDADNEDDIIDEVADEIDVDAHHVEAVLDIEGDRRSSSSNGDEEDAEDAMDDADDAIDEAEEEIEDAEADGDDVDWAEDTLKDAKRRLSKAEDAFDDEDWDEAIELAEEAEELAEDAIDRIDEEEDDNDSDEIDVIEAEVVGEDETEVYVEYENGDEEKFDVEEDRKDKIIAEIADELNIDEDEVEDLIEFDYGELDEVVAYFEADRVRVEIEFESGVSVRLKLDEDLDEDEVIEEIAEEFDLDEDDVEDIIDFEYDN